MQKTTLGIRVIRFRDVGGVASGKTLWQYFLFVKRCQPYTIRN